MVAGICWYSLEIDDLNAVFLFVVFVLCELPFGQKKGEIGETSEKTRNLWLFWEGILHGGCLWSMVMVRTGYSLCKINNNDGICDDT